MKYIFLCLSWILWCFLHSFFTTTGVTEWFKERLKKKFAFYRIGYNSLSLITVVPLFYWQMTMGGVIVIRISAFLMIFKYIAICMSVIVITGSFLSFDVFEFVGIRQIMSRHSYVQKQITISKHGFYGVVRHPMYAGGFVFFVAMMMNAPLSQFLGYGILAIYMVIGTVREDRRLARGLGEVYRNYQKQVPMFIPRILSRGD
jgi:protein-S-isoprenylcysteine O-methyltransferase Ste14